MTEIVAVICWCTLLTAITLCAAAVVIRLFNGDGVIEETWQIAEIRISHWGGKREIEYITTIPSDGFDPGNSCFAFDESSIKSIRKVERDEPKEKKYEKVKG